MGDTVLFRNPPRHGPDSHSWVPRPPEFRGGARIPAPRLASEQEPPAWSGPGEGRHGQNLFTEAISGRTQRWRNRKRGARSSGPVTPSGGPRGWTGSPEGRAVLGRPPDRPGRRTGAAVVRRRWRRTWAGTSAPYGSGRGGVRTMRSTSAWRSWGGGVGRPGGRSGTGGDGSCWLFTPPE